MLAHSAHTSPFRLSSLSFPNLASAIQALFSSFVKETRLAGAMLSGVSVSGGGCGCLDDPILLSDGNVREEVATGKDDFEGKVKCGIEVDGAFESIICLNIVGEGKWFCPS